jgi:hypothetical protein
MTLGGPSVPILHQQIALRAGKLAIESVIDRLANHFRCSSNGNESPNGPATLGSLMSRVDLDDVPVFDKDPIFDPEDQ